MLSFRRLATLVVLAMPVQAWAQTEVTAPDTGDSAWVMVAAIITFFAALPGLALFHGRGRIGASGLSLFVTASSTTLVFALIGYTLAFGPGGTLIGGTMNAGMRFLPDLMPGSALNGPTHAFYQLSLATLVTCILVASVAERARFTWLVGFAPLWVLLVYVPLARWTFGGGVIMQLGALDYAGGMVIHGAAGVAALVIAMMLGIPVGRQVAHDSRLAIAGVALTWLGLLGAIGGAAFAADLNAASALLNAQIAAAAAAIVGALLERSRTGTSSFYGAATAAISGLAAMAAGAPYVGGLGAMAIGAAGAVIAAWSAAAVRALSLGSAASAFVIHGGPGLAGALLYPLLISPMLGGPGLAEGESIARLALGQLVAVGVVVIWTTIVTVIAALTVSILVPMRQREAT